MTEAEEKLLAATLSPEAFDGSVQARQALLDTRLAVALERVPAGFQAELGKALNEREAAQKRVRDLVRQHPIACLGEKGLLRKMGAEL
jgi:hypothetical protein